jgi:hypothetical protein
MKVKLLKRIRQQAANEVTVYSITKTNGVVTGMRYGMNSDAYRGLFSYGNTEQDVMRKALQIYFKNNLDAIRKKYAKYSRKHKAVKIH